MQLFFLTEQKFEKGGRKDVEEEFSVFPRERQETLAS